MFINIIAVGFRDSEDSISTVQTLQDCGSSVPFLSQCFLSKDPSSGTIHISNLRTILIMEGVEIDTQTNAGL